MPKCKVRSILSPVRAAVSAQSSNICVNALQTFCLIISFCSFVRPETDFGDVSGSRLLSAIRTVWSARSHGGIPVICECFRAVKAHIIVRDLMHSPHRPLCVKRMN